MAHNTVPIEKGNLVFNGELTVGQIRRMSVQDGSLDGIIEVLSEIVSEWPYSGTPADMTEWDKLTLPQFNEIVTTITDELGKELK